MQEGLCHIEIKTVKRSAGQSVVAAVAYREASKLVDERLGQTHDYTRKRGVEHVEQVVPDGVASLSSAELWNMAERAEKRKDGVVGREYMVALPHELSLDERKALAFAFTKLIVDRFGVGATVALHAPTSRGGDPRNFHAHIVTTTRVLGPDGLGAKTVILDNLKTTGHQEVARLRNDWAELANRFLERRGSEYRLDPRAFKDRDEQPERIPEVHLGPAATAMERRGERTELGDRNRAIRERNAISKLQVELREELKEAEKQEYDRQEAAAKREVEEQAYASSVLAITSAEPSKLTDVQKSPSMISSVGKFTPTSCKTKKGYEYTRYMPPGERDWRAGFADFGRSIRFARGARPTDEAIVAALVLGMAKWGGCLKILGDEAYQMRVRGLATRMGYVIDGAQVLTPSAAELKTEEARRQAEAVQKAVEKVERVKEQTQSGGHTSTSINEREAEDNTLALMPGVKLEKGLAYRIRDEYLTYMSVTSKLAENGKRYALYNFRTADGQSRTFEAADIVATIELTKEKIRKELAERVMDAEKVTNELEREPKLDVVKAEQVVNELNASDQRDSGGPAPQGAVPVQNMEQERAQRRQATIQKLDDEIYAERGKRYAESLAAFKALKEFRESAPSEPGVLDGLLGIVGLGGRQKYEDAQREYKKLLNHAADCWRACGGTVVVKNGQMHWEGQAEVDRWRSRSATRAEATRRCDARAADKVQKEAERTTQNVAKEKAEPTQPAVPAPTPEPQDVPLAIEDLREGQEVVFRPHDGSMPLIGTVEDVDEQEQQVTLAWDMPDGREALGVVNAKTGVFHEAQPLSHEETREYAEEVARRFIGQDGTIRYVSVDAEAEYIGKVRDVTPSFVILQSSPETATLFRLKDLRKSEREAQQMVGQTLSISRDASGAMRVKTQAHAVTEREVQTRRDTDLGR